MAKSRDSASKEPKSALLGGWPRPGERVRDKRWRRECNWNLTFSTGAQPSDHPLLVPPERTSSDIFGIVAAGDLVFRTREQRAHQTSATTHRRCMSVAEQQRRRQLPLQRQW